MLYVCIIKQGNSATNNQIMSVMETIKECVDQLLKCNYECEGGYLKNNIAFIRLQEIANSNYQPRFFINEEVYFQDKIYFVCAIKTESSSYPNPECRYDLSEEWHHEATTNVVSIPNVIPIKKSEYINKKIDDAKKFLKDQGITKL